jgi:malonyl-CoA O-methyltransferase
MMDLKNIGASNATLERQRGLMSKQTLKQLESAYQSFRLSDGSYPLSYEVVYGHAWSSAGISVSDGRTVIPIKAL